MPLFLALEVTLDGVTVPIAVGALGVVLVYVTWALRGLLQEVRAELDQAREERNAARDETAEERKVAAELRREVGRLRRVVSALIRVISDAGLPVPEEAYEEAGL